MRFTPADKEYFTAVRQEDASIDQMFKDMRALMEKFAGSKILYLKVRDSEWGEEQPMGEPYVPLPRIETIQKGKKPQQRALTVAERRRAQTKYK